MKYHSRCVDNTAADTEWYCPEGCRNNLDDSAEQAREQPDAATDTDCPAVGQAEEFDAERWIREKQEEIEMELAERQAQIDRELREKEEKMAEAIRKVMRRQEANLELERKKKADHERRMADLQSSFQRRSSLINEQLELTKYGFEKILQCPQIVNSTSEEEAEDEKKIEREESSNEDRDGSAKSRVEDTGENGTKLNKQDVSGTLYGLGQQGSGLEKARLAAGGGRTRQSPCYPNDPEWLPKSYGTQQKPSESCGVVDGADLGKLQSWLKGAALDTGHRTLRFSRRLLVDRPELLQRSHAESSRGIEHPEAEKFATLTTLKSAANQLYERTKATDITLVYPLAIEDPASVLPIVEERLWATKKAEIKIFSSKNNSDMIAETSRRRQTEDADLCCQEEDSSSLTRANQMQPRVRHDRQLRFCGGMEEMFDDERTKIVASWNRGDNQRLEKRGQSNTCWELYNQVVLPIHERNTVALIVGAQVVRLDLGDVPGKLARQRSAEASHVCPRFTRMNEWVSAAQVCSGLVADDGQLQELIGKLRLMLPALIALGNHQHNAAPKDPDKPKKKSAMQESVEYVQQDPTVTDAKRSHAKSIAGCTVKNGFIETMVSGSAHENEPVEALKEVDRVHTRMKAANSTNTKPVQQRNLRSAVLDLKTQAEDGDFLKQQWLSRRELADEAKNHVPKSGGHDEDGNKLHHSNSIPLRHPGVSLLAMTSCKAHDGVDDNEGGQKLHRNAANISGSVPFSTAKTHEQLDSAARECVGTGGDADLAFAIDMTAVNWIVEENLPGLDGAQRLTDGISRTTNSSVGKGKGVPAQWHQTEEADQSEQKSRVNTAVPKDLGKSYEPDGPTDVTGWGVTTA
ncbi:uncharacterized protein LOC6036528 [Culex quinquefasciatus]|uniref:uncharacterized protein LOC6036528 n=1 Tax=Culex quinquefasciatus TaxID=7176 RepID=UPI0018E2D1A6|nr:uncharacterized protein LOC6036528 [Culex quinquefasciatus]XP_038114005.1 uncharacterized protein LOC6036528 [Culex quinquefasciatus]